MSERVPAGIIDKIKKIQALAERGEQGEMENAAAMLSRLLLKHNLTLSELDLGERPNVEVTIMDGAQPFTWRGELMHQLANHHFCRVVAYGSNSTVWAIVGNPQNQNVVKEMYSWLEEEIHRRGSEALIQAMVTPVMDIPSEITTVEGYIRATRDIEDRVESWRMANERPREWADSWRVGAVRGITDRLEEERKSADKESSALVRLDTEVDDYIENHLKVEQKKRVLKCHDVVYGAGRETGRGIGVHRSLDEAGNGGDELQ